MNYFILTGKNPPDSGAFLKATETIRNNGHIIVDDPDKADVIIITKESDKHLNIHIIQSHIKHNFPSVAHYSGWDNWLVREFF